jgi:hypothetical protein
MKASKPPADAPIPTMENAFLPGCAKPASTGDREGRLAAGGAFGSGLRATARERDDGESLPGLLAARFTVRFFGELYLVCFWCLAFIGDFAGALSDLLRVVPL